MVYRLEEVLTDEDFKPLFVAFRAGFSEPWNALWALFMADWRPHDAAARAGALEEGTARLLSWHRADPTSTWLRVVDGDTGEIVAGGRWSIYDSGAPNPYDGHAPLEALWFPDGEPRVVATQLMNQFLDSAARRMNRPHAFLNILFTVPGHRRKGAASLVMDWGFKIAKEKRLPVFIEATKEGKPLYEKYGCKAVAEESLVVDEATLPPAEDAELRKEVIQAVTPFTWWSMLKEADS